MSRMSEQHDDLSTIHAILLGQRKVAQDKIKEGGAFSTFWRTRRDAIDDLLLEIEAAGVVWPDNVVELNVQESWDQGKPVFYHG